MKIGFSLSPGGLLFPYHLGVLEGLASKGALDANTPLAGASAGAIAVACHGCGLDGPSMLDATTKLSAQCTVSGGSSRLLTKGLRAQMQSRIGPEHMERLTSRPGIVGIAYRQIFPRSKSILQTQFESVDDLADAVCHSSTFPFFSSPYPCSLDTKSGFPRLFVDGFFCVPRDRFGCPDFDQLEVEDNNNDNVTVDRTVCICCFPKDLFGLTAVSERDCISPFLLEHVDPNLQIQDLVGLAMTPLESGSKQYAKLYENGFLDAEHWVAREAQDDDVRKSTSSLALTLEGGEALN